MITLQWNARGYWMVQTTTGGFQPLSRDLGFGAKDKVLRTAAGAVLEAIDGQAPPADAKLVRYGRKE